MTRRCDQVAPTPEPPYTAVIFTSVRTHVDDGYDQTSAELERLASRQPGFLGVESAREAIGITVSYWRDDAAARAWKLVGEHLLAQRRGRNEWYRNYRVRIAEVRRDYGPDDPADETADDPADETADDPADDRAERGLGPLTT
jgi:heme-degrading monooxygenase HmoA